MVEFRPYVYFENILVVNLALNGLIIWVTGKFAGCKIRPWRLGLSALVGALFSFAVLFPAVAWATGYLLKLGLSILMLVIGFGPLPVRQFIVCMVYFFLISFVLGGAVLATAFNATGLFGSYNLARNLPTLSYALIVVFVGGWMLAHWGNYLLKSRTVQNWFKYQLTICLHDQSIQVKGLVDTGNQLRDPLSGWPVLVVEKAAVAALLPPGIDGLLAGNAEPDSLFFGEQSDWIQRLKLIPFNSLGAKNGLLLGFRPDKVVLQREGSEQILEQVIIGVTEETLSPQGSYQALLHPDLLDSGMSI